MINIYMQHFIKQLTSKDLCISRGCYSMGFPGGSLEKNPPIDVGDTKDLGSISVLGRSPGEGYGSQS